MSSTNPMMATGTPMTSACLAIATTPTASTSRAPSDKPRNSDPEPQSAAGDRAEAEP